MAVAVAAWRQRGGQCGGITVAAAALLQRNVSGGSTINNQLKASAATATDTVMMIATTATIKTKEMVAAAAAWRQRGRKRGKIAVAAAALLQCNVSGSSTINNQLKVLVCNN